MTSSMAVGMARLSESRPAREPKPPRRSRTAAAAILAWYDESRRRLPWRYDPGEPADPYAVWLSEIMLQQTTVAAVIPYFQRFMSRWPTVAALAAAPLDDVLAAWAGLGYYARARNLHRCAMAVAGDHGGAFPTTEAALRTLPGIGPYTAAAVAAIAFGRRAVVVDGNVERVMARLYDVRRPLPGIKPKLHGLADALTPNRRAGDYAQAVMDLGATVCTPKSPDCGRCPWRKRCAALRAGIAERLPRRATKAASPTRVGAALWITRPDGAVLLRRRPPKGLLGGMLEIPSTAWKKIEPGAKPDVGSIPERLDTAHAAIIAELDARPLPGRVEHTFTHFKLILELAHAKIDRRQADKIASPDLLWVHPRDFDRRALPSVMKKLAALALRRG
jgi:A/G-specific adenine glycosylase